jgi:lipoate---protein ligase
MMHQTVDRDRPPGEQLDEDRRLFELVETGAVDSAQRMWECAMPVVVLGRHQPPAAHVLAERCEAEGVPVLRRCSGGGAVVLGPGCLAYTIVLPMTDRPGLADVSESFRELLAAFVDALALPGLEIRGGQDLAIQGRKVSGNAQRRGRRALLQHGTLLYSFDALLAARYLIEPARQPAYRRRRPHVSFLGNLPLDGGEVAKRIATALRALTGRATLSSQSR